VSSPTTTAGGPRLGPKILTARFGLPQSWTLERYLGTGGYEGLRRALAMAPEEVHQAVTAASILGRGGAGFDAARKWAMLRQAEPVYLVVNGDESEPATFKDHALMEGDPHQLIEGTLICA
jgi:NADH-quinone oxidoreductase subunit F